MQGEKITSLEQIFDLWEKDRAIVFPPDHWSQGLPISAAWMLNLSSISLLHAVKAGMWGFIPEPSHV